mmetsp:Transcript_20610/g.69173  ORF Transcript_20610/g.69173 Transcript_20610/m.69173 type:complete len:230 (+) Transcript_20610:17-706(+)
MRGSCSRPTSARSAGGSSRRPRRPWPRGCARTAAGTARRTRRPSRPKTFGPSASPSRRQWTRACPRPSRWPRRASAPPRTPTRGARAPARPRPWPAPRTRPRATPCSSPWARRRMPTWATWTTSTRRAAPAGSRSRPCCPRPTGKDWAWAGRTSTTSPCRNRRPSDAAGMGAGREGLGSCGALPALGREAAACRRPAPARLQMITQTDLALQRGLGQGRRHNESRSEAT